MIASSLSGRRHARYIASVFLLVAVLMAAVLDALWRQDLYGQHLDPATQAAHYRPAAVAREQFRIKPYQVLAAEPDALVIGGSVSARMPVQHDYWQGLHTYNSAWMMMNMREAWQLLQTADRHHALQQVLLVMDDGQFAPHLRDEYRNQRYSVDENGERNHFQWWQRGLDTLGLLLSPLARQYALLGAQAPAPDLLLTVGGEWDALPETYDIATASWERLQRVARPNTAEISYAYEAYRQFVRYCHQHHIRLEVVVPPKHAAILSATVLNGSQSRVDEWKRQLVQIAEEEAASAQQPAFAVWDFENYAPLYRHVLDQSVMNQQQAWLWDGLHGNRGMGRCMLDFLQSQREGRDAVDPQCRGLAERLDSRTFDQHLQQVAAQREQYRRDFPQIDQVLLRIHEAASHE